jgi:transcriptional regulator with XRE-family HTH domain
LRWSFSFPPPLFLGEIWGNADLNFEDAQLRLIAYVLDRLHNGEFTERSFARMVGISQPHIHNVLKGVRSPSLELCDSILKNLHITMLDLVPKEDLEHNLNLRKPPLLVPELPFLDAVIGPGEPWPPSLDAPLRQALSIIRHRFVMVRLAWDPQMAATLAPYDIAILDASDRHKIDPTPEGLYVVEREGNTMVRYIRPGARCYYLVSDATLEDPGRWEQLSISAGNLSRLIKARVLWLGRERDRKLPMRQWGRFLYDAISS